MNDDFFRANRELRKALEQVMEPIRRQQSVLQEIVSPVSLITNQIKGIDLARDVNDGLASRYEGLTLHLANYESVTSQVAKILAPLKDIKLSAIEAVKISAFDEYLDSYREARNFINNFDIYIEDADAVEGMAKFKEQYGDLPDIEEDVIKFSAEQIEELTEMFEIYTKRIIEDNRESEEDSYGIKEGMNDFALPANVIQAVIFYINFLWLIWNLFDK